MLPKLPPHPSPILFPYTTLFRSILKREDVEPYEGREVKPIDDGWFSEKHATARNGSSKSQTPNPKFKRRILRAKNGAVTRSEEHTSELQSHSDLVCRLLLEKKKL